MSDIIAVGVAAYMVNEQVLVGSTESGTVVQVTATRYPATVAPGTTAPSLELERFLSGKRWHGLPWNFTGLVLLVLFGWVVRGYASGWEAPAPSR
jgi:hypothetical protein